MAGALTHIGIGIAAALVVHFIHFKLEYSLSIFVGSLLPDAIKFGFSAIKQLTLHVFSVEKDSFYTGLNDITSAYVNWFSIGFFILGVGLLLFHFHYIKKKTMEEYDELYVFLLVGIIIHLILDTLIIERSMWL